MIPSQKNLIRKIKVNDQKNLFLAIGLSVLIIIVFQLLIPQQTMMPSTPQENLEDIAENNNLHYITAPLVGTFYLTPNPEDSPFIEKGGKIELHIPKKEYNMSSSITLSVFSSCCSSNK